MLARFREQVGSAGVFAAPSRTEMQCTQGVVVPQPQVVEAYDVSQGSCWHDGLNRSIPAAALGSHTTDLIRREAEENSLRITGMQPNKGRGLETLTARRDGDIACDASALFWDDLGEPASVCQASGQRSLWRSHCPDRQGEARLGRCVPACSALRRYSTEGKLHLGVRPKQRLQ